MYSNACTKDDTFTYHVRTIRNKQIAFFDVIGDTELAAQAAAVSRLRDYEEDPYRYPLSFISLATAPPEWVGNNDDGLQVWHCGLNCKLPS
jgi:hypothetical protein